MQPTVARLTDWNAEEGWGVLGCEQTPGGCWFLLSALVGVHPQELVVGESYQLVFETADQDGYRYRALTVSPVGLPIDSSTRRPSEPTSSGGFTSTLSLRFDQAPGKAGLA